MLELPDAVCDAADGAEPAQGQHPHLGPVRREGAVWISRPFLVAIVTVSEEASDGALPGEERAEVVGALVAQQHHRVDARAQRQQGRRRLQLSHQDLEKN